MSASIPSLFFVILALAFPRTMESTTTRRAPALAVSVEGAKPKVPRGVDLTLRAVASWSGPSAELRFAWTSLEGPPLPHGADVTSSVMSIPASELRPGLQYRLRLRVVAQWKASDGEPRFATAARDVAFEVNAPPRGGKCTLEARRIGPRQAMLTLAAPAWTDSDELAYTFFLVRNQKEMLVRDWSTATRAQTVVALRARDSLRAKCVVRDKLGDSVTVRSGTITRAAND